MNTNMLCGSNSRLNVALYAVPRRHARHPPLQHSASSADTEMSHVLYDGDGVAVGGGAPGGGTPGSGGAGVGPYLTSGIRGELLAILNELRFITRKIKDENDNAEETNDWKFAAMVIDRLCFYIFSLYLIVATIAIFTSPKIALGI